MIDSDLNRDLWPIMGLPLDAVNIDEAMAQVFTAVDQQKPLFISTPNLNFIITALTDQSFRQSIVNSDLCLADGMPLIWIAKLLKLPIKERVSGSGLIAALMACKTRASKPVKVFFFGGQDGVADTACQNLRENPCGLTAVGSLNPGFGNIQEMSQPHIIESINESGAEFVIVSLGAKKGQEWIEHNRARLHAPVISHLGAVVNFVAETSERAPIFFQRTGLEWLWRIKEEPSLWRRYFFDGVGLLKICITKLLPYSLLIVQHRRNASQLKPLSITRSDQEGELFLFLQGSISTDSLRLLRNELKDIPPALVVHLDLSEVSYLEPAFIGLIFVLRKSMGEQLQLQNASPRVKKIFNYNCVDFLLD